MHLPHVECSETGKIAPRHCSWFLTVVVLSSAGCVSHSEPCAPFVEPQSYVFLDADHGWGHIVTLRIVDWGDDRIHISVTDSAGRQKIGQMSRAEYRRLTAELRSLRALDLDSFSRSNVNDADLYRIDIRLGAEHNRIRIYCPWYDVGDANTPAMMAASDSYGSKPHADLVQRLLDEAERDDLRWDVCTYAFHPDRRLVDTEGVRRVEDLFFADDGELNYATTEYPKWAGGTADGDDGSVVWHSIDRRSEPRRVPFDVIEGGNKGGSGPVFARPVAVTEAVPGALPSIEYSEVEHLVHPRVFCDGKVGVCVASSNGIRLIAYLVDYPTAYWPVLWLDDVPVDRQQIDISPDGSRAAWINEGRLFVADDVATSCDQLLEHLQWQVER